MTLPAHHRHWIREEAAMAAIILNTAHQAAGRQRQVPRRSRVAIGRQSGRAGISSAEEAAVAGPFQPLDSGVVSDAIPAFFIGRNKQGFWVARDVKGKTGGIFLFENSALAFARKNSWPDGCAIISPSGRIELDLENNGNPLVAQPGSLLRLRQRMTALIGKAVQLPTIQRICFWAVAMLAAGAAAGVIALRTAVFFWRFHH
jgi:hypothetical protein